MLEQEAKCLLNRTKRLALIRAEAVRKDSGNENPNNPNSHQQIVKLLRVEMLRCSGYCGECDWRDKYSDMFRDSLEDSGKLDSVPEATAPPDLTRYGVEPNPGPAKMAPKSKPRKTTKPKSKATSKTNILHNVKPGSKGIHGKGGFFEDAGSWLGKKAGSWLAKITGVGDYTVQSNTISHPNDPPILSNTAGATRVQHREFICDISGTTGFSVRRYPINPGLVDTFPWLASVAAAFEQYRMHGMVFEFKSTSAVALNSTNTALGTVIMATEYNPLLASFASKREMENHVYSTSSPPSVSAMHPIECARDASVMTNLYTRNVAPVTNNDIRFADLGAFQLATTGMQAANVIGELWVTYDVELMKPKLPDAFVTTPVTHYAYDLTLYPTATAPTAADLFGTGGVQKYATRGLGLTNVTLTTNTITFLTSGTYMLLFNFIGGAAAAAMTTTWTAGGAVTVSNIWCNNSATPTFQAAGAQSALAGQTNMIYAITVTVVVDGVTPATLVNAGSTLPTAVIAANLFVIGLPSGFTLTNEPSEEERYSRLAEQLRRLEMRLHLETDFDVVDEKQCAAVPQSARTAGILASLAQSIGAA